MSRFCVIPNRGLIECEGSEEFVERNWKVGVELLDLHYDRVFSRKVIQGIVQIIDNKIRKEPPCTKS